MNGLRNIINMVVPIASKRKSATATLLAKRFSFRDVINAVEFVPKFAPSIIGIDTSIGINPLWASITIRPVINELDCTIAVKRTLMAYAIRGFERLGKRDIISGLLFNGSSAEDIRESESRRNPIWNIGLPIILLFLPKELIKKPITINSGASIVESINTSCAVSVVPILLPKRIPMLLWNDIAPVFTSRTIITVTALLDCTKAVSIAPKRVPTYLFLENFVKRSLNFVAANS